MKFDVGDKVVKKGFFSDSEGVVVRVFNEDKVLVKEFDNQKVVTYDVKELELLK